MLIFSVDTESTAIISERSGKELGFGEWGLGTAGPGGQGGPSPAGGPSAREAPALRPPCRVTSCHSRLCCREAQLEDWAEGLQALPAGAGGRLGSSLLRARETPSQGASPLHPLLSIQTRPRWWGGEVRGGDLRSLLTAHEVLAIQCGPAPDLCPLLELPPQDLPPHFL